MGRIWEAAERIPHYSEWNRNEENNEGNNEWNNGENRENSMGTKIFETFSNWLQNIAKTSLYVASGKFILDWVEYFCATTLDIWKNLLEWEDDALALFNIITKDEKWKNEIERFLKTTLNSWFNKNKRKEQLVNEMINVAINNYYDDFIIHLKSKIISDDSKYLFENIMNWENGKNNIKQLILIGSNWWKNISQLIINLNNEKYYSTFNQAIQYANKAMYRSNRNAQESWYNNKEIQNLRQKQKIDNPKNDDISYLIWEQESPEVSNSIEFFEDSWEDYWEDQDEMPMDFEDIWQDLTIQGQLWEAKVYLKYYFNNNREFYEKFINFYHENKNNWPNIEDPNYAQEQKILEYARNPNISRGLSIKTIEFYRIYYKFLLEQEKNNWNLPKQLQFQKKYLEDMFNRMDQRVINYNKKRKNIEAPIRRLRHREKPRRIETDNTVKWDLNSLSPFDIVRWNKSIRKYVFGDNEWDDSNPDKPRLKRITIETLKEKWIYQNLFNWILGTQEFSIYKEFFNSDGSIKYDLLWKEINWIVVLESDISQLETIKKDIESEILRKARRENFWNFINEIDEKRKENTIDVSCRMSAMMCCIRAIKSFFDTKAGDFQIEDVNENIHFIDNNPRLLSMEWTMNGKYIKLYYNLDAWELRFDRFLWYDETNREYKIWKNNNIQENVIKNLPTIGKMEDIARNTPIANLPTTLWRDFARINTLFRSEHIRAKEFISDWWSTLNVNKRLVEKFYEKNLLEQEIISCIYGNFYEWENIFNGNYPLIIWANQPEQLKMIELISNSIEHYKNDAHKLWQFRNCIAMLWDLLKNKDKVENCSLLKNLFLDDRRNDQDAYSQTISTLQKENPWATLKDLNSIIQNSETIVQTQWSKDINFYTLLNLFATWNWNMRHIDVGVLDNIVNKISKEADDPLPAYLNEYHGDSSNVFSKNYEEAVKKSMVPDYVGKKTDDELAWNLEHMDSPNNET